MFLHGIKKEGECVKFKLLKVILLSITLSALLSACGGGGGGTSGSGGPADTRCKVGSSTVGDCTLG